MSKLALSFVTLFAIFYSASSVTAQQVETAVNQQAKKLPVIGFLLGSSERVHGPYVDQLRQSLKEAGVVDGRNIVLESRFAKGNRKLARKHASEFVQRPVDVIVTVGRPPTRSAAKATKTIPIVVAFASDLAESGLVTNMARPEGNVTGLTALTSDLAAKRLQLLTEAVPGISRVALLFSPTKSAISANTHTKLASKSLGLTVHEIRVRGPDDFADAFAEMTKHRVEGVIMVAGPVISLHRRKLTKLTIDHKLPTICWRLGVARAGCLMSYGADRSAMVNRAAGYVVKILRGAKPADLPVQRPNEFQIAVNFKTAQKLGITIPPSFLLRATEVIE
jgi:putative ABC transport system substrate-binding protein